MSAAAVAHKVPPPRGRVEQLQEFIRANPKDPFPRYALALEHKNSGRLDEASVTFAELMSELPDYVPAYLQAGNTLVARGLTNREIAAALVVAEGSAANYVKRILAKLGFRSRAQVAVWAARHDADTVPDA